MANTIIGTLCSKDSDRHKIISKSVFDNFTIELDKQYTWDVGIDQSTSCTGITFYAVDGPYFLVFDIYRDKSIDKSFFYSSLKRFLWRTLQNVNVGNLIYEKPIPNAKFRTAQNVLHELKGRLEEWIAEIPELYNANVDSLLPQVWKSYVVQKVKGVDKTNNKALIALDLVERFPALKEYYDLYEYSSFDGFDSLGILIGYYAYAFTPEGYPQIHGTLEKRHSTTVFYQGFDESENFIEKMREYLGVMLNIPELANHKVELCNPRYNWQMNVRIASSNEDSCITLVPDTQVEALHWEFDFPEDEHLSALIVRSSSISKRDIKILEQMFPMQETIYGE